MTTITVRFQGNDYTARILTGEDWQDAARRAIRRAAGRSSTVRGWIVDSWEEDGHGRTTRRHYRATICGPASRTGGAPILGEARVSV